MSTRFLLTAAAAAALAAVLSTTWIVRAATPRAAGVETLAADTATLFRAARLTISDAQTHINDASVGDKGLTGDVVVEATKKNFAKAAGRELAAADDSEFGRVQKAMFDAIDATMTEAQPLINEAGKGFKGFLPAVFAKRVADRFSKSMDGRVTIKLTAPKELVRNRANRPDDWEANVIDSKFKAKDWSRGASFGEYAESKGKRGYRLIIPEYYGASCLSCHGEPKGEVDITGGKKEGAKLDDLGGAVSVVVFE